jgi:hypothetical protein
MRFRVKNAAVRSRMKVKVTRGPSDPICTRVSIGGNHELGAYCVYRGSIEVAISVTEAALAELKLVKASGHEPKVDRNYKELGAS